MYRVRKISLPIRREKITLLTTVKIQKRRTCHSKDIQGWELSNELEKFVVKFFGGGTAKDMESYIQPKVECAPSNAILHCGTNDLKTSSYPEQIA